MDGRKRIALYGGTFDPVHVGHLEIARKLLQLFALDELLFIPAYVAPHKRESEVTPAWHRYACLALATQNEDALCVSTIELDAPERPYTFETLTRLQIKLGFSARLFFVMGADSWSEIDTWREWERVLSLTDQIVITRPGYELSAAHVTPHIRAKLVDLRGASEARVASEIDNRKTDEGTKIFVTDAVLNDVSATAIRRAVRDGRSDEWERLVPPPVAEYIRKYRLYR
ncbi:MAG: nicotinate-nucleotide adenylyltransferase [Pyrinomonadaceae bacterium]